MEKAKSAVQGFLHKNGHEDTTVHESTNKAVQNEHVTRTQHNEAQTAVDREVHQDHHHTTVQPVKHNEVLPEKHTHQMAPVEHRSFEHGNHDHTQQRLDKERAQFQNTREVGDVEHTHGHAAAIGGEHIHHHVHENIQPVIQKETVQPSVVHTTQPIHEVHHNEAKHHGASTLPAVSLGEFQKNGGALGGSGTRHDAFEGAPKGPSHEHPIGGVGARGTTSVTSQNGHQAAHNHGATSGETLHQNQNHAVTGGSTGSAATSGKTTGTHKPSLMDKLNPKKDADGDGKAGFMD